MSATRITDPRSLGAFLRERRTRLDPAAFGIAGSRRRTRGLRREEVAQRADISATWYVWLEQGRGGRPSADVLDRIARALSMTEREREHLFLIGLGRPPDTRVRAAPSVSARLQRVLDALACSPAIVMTAMWDVVAWNRAAAVVLTDYGQRPPDARNILRMIFTETRVRAAQPEWASVARFVVASFRLDAARAGADVEPLVDELCRSSPEFAALWRAQDVEAHGDGVKHLLHAELGPLALEYSAFAVDDRPDLRMIVYNPATAADRARIEAAVTASHRGRPPAMA